MQGTQLKEPASDVDDVTNNTDTVGANIATNGHAKCVDGHEEDKEILSEPEVSARRFSTRRSKRSAISIRDNNITESIGATNQTVTDSISLTTSDETTTQTKQRRGWKTWTTHDVKLFFDALAEYGKDFSAIQSFIQAKVSEASKKGGKSNVSSNISSNVSSSSSAISASSSSFITSSLKKDNVIDIKSKEQVRHFYYRTWHKISAALVDITKVDVLKGHSDSSPEKASKASELSESSFNCSEIIVDKAILELYGLINYGEIWKRIGGTWNDKIKSHLRELVLEGVTVIKSSNKNVKSKTNKIKTPLCKALKKINNVTSDSDHGNTCTDPLPEQVAIELIPINNYSFMKVQSLAQNPCVKCKVESSSKVSDFVEFLEGHLWSPNTLRMQLHKQFSGLDIPPPRQDSKVHITLPDSLISSLESNKSLVKVVKHFSSTFGDSINSSPSSINGQVSEAHGHAVNSSANLSFKSYVTRFNKLPSGAQFVKANVKKSTGASSARSLMKNFQNSADEPKKDVASEPFFSSPVKSSLTFDGEESCSSSSSIAPLRETVKKLAQLNKALSMASDSSQDSFRDTPTSMRLHHESPVKEKEPLVNESSDQLAATESGDEVSLPPPTSTLAQWLNFKEHQRQLEESQKLSNATADPSLQTTSAKSTKDISPTEFSSPSKNISDFNQDILTIDSVRQGWSSDETSLTFGQLYMLLKSPECIELMYEFRPRKRTPQITSASESEQQYFMQSLSLEERNKDSMCLLDKLLFAASISLSTYKKTSSPVSTAFQANSRSFICSKAQSKPTSSQSNVVAGQNLAQNSASSSNSPCSSQVNQHNFLVPSAPAPRSIATASTATTVQDSRWEMEAPVCKSNKRQKPITQDPQVLQEAFKQLNENRLVPRKRQRIRPTPVSGSNIPLLPRLAANTIMTQTPTQIQIVAHSAPSIPVQQSIHHPVTESLTATNLNSVTAQGVTATAAGLSLPICLTSPGVPTILIPIAANINNGTLTPTSVQGSLVTTNTESAANTVKLPTQSLTPIVLPSPFASSEANVTCNFTPPSSVASANTASSAAVVSANISNGKETSQVVQVEKVTSCSAIGATGSASTSTLPCLSSLLELSLPDSIATSSSITSSTVSTMVTSSATLSGPNLNSTAFFNDNSCSSISEFISFGQSSNAHHMTGSESTLNTPTKEQITGEMNNSTNSHANDASTNKPPSWLLNEGSNSSSLGLSSLIFSANELI